MCPQVPKNLIKQKIPLYFNYWFWFKTCFCDMPEAANQTMLFHSPPPNFFSDWNKDLVTLINKIISCTHISVLLGDYSLEVPQSTTWMCIYFLTGLHSLFLYNTIRLLLHKFFIIIIKLLETGQLKILLMYIYVELVLNIWFEYVATGWEQPPTIPVLWSHPSVFPLLVPAVQNKLVHGHWTADEKM